MIFCFDSFCGQTLQQHSFVFTTTPLLSTILDSNCQTEMKKVWNSLFFFPCCARENRKNVQEVLWIAWLVMTRSQRLQHSLRTILKWWFYFGSSKMYKNNPFKKKKRRNNRMCKKWASGAVLLFCWTIWTVTDYHCQSCHAGVTHRVPIRQARGVSWLKRAGNRHRSTHLCSS